MDRKRIISLISLVLAVFFFAGVALKGAVIAPDNEANHTYYDGAVDVKEILFGQKIVLPASSRSLIQTLKSFSK